jgi:glucose-6-phosphate isomerase
MNTDTAIHNTLQRLAAGMRDQPLAALLKDATRARGLVWQLDDLRVDLSRQYLNDSVMAHLQDFGDSRGLADKIDALFAGEAVNVSEGRAVVHMAQRAQTRIDSDEFAGLSAFAQSVRDSDVADVINIGIGGSDLGPAMVSAALAHLSSGPRLHYVSNVDPAHLHDVLRGCDPARTLVIVTSKTFTTDETMRNAALAADWLAAGGNEGALAAVTAAPDVASLLTGYSILMRGSAGVIHFGRLSACR